MVFFKNGGAINFLEKFFVADQRLIQNFLFWGEESVGKMTTAQAFSAALLCGSQKKEWQGCGQCDSCRMLQKGYHPDLMILRPGGEDEDGGKRSIGIEQIRESIQFLLYHPQISSLKILIIDEADRMTEESQNALLKTLEEPRLNNIIILISSAPKKLLTTIRSRILPIRFTTAADEEIVDFLRHSYHLSAPAAAEIASRADGKIGRVIKLLDRDYKKELDKMRRDLADVLRQNFAGQSAYFQKISGDDRKLTETLEEWLRFLRTDCRTTLRIDDRRRVELLDDILRAVYLISSTNVNRQLLLENIFLNA